MGTKTKKSGTKEVSKKAETKKAETVTSNKKNGKKVEPKVESKTKTSSKLKEGDKIVFIKEEKKVVGVYLKHIDGNRGEYVVILYKGKALFRRPDAVEKQNK
jgi:predicted RNA-binding protein with PUA domain